MDENTPDDYITAATNAFNYCEVEEKIHVNELMDKFPPFMKKEMTQYIYLKTLLEPNGSNPAVDLKQLAFALNKYHEDHNCKVDWDESFNMKVGQVPHDSDSGISTDSLQFLEDEVKEKNHAVQRLRAQLEFSDRQHEEALVAMASELDSLRMHFTVLSDENKQLTRIKADYDTVSERLCTCERSLEVTNSELETAKRNNRELVEQVAYLEGEKVTLQELLNKSKEECHRINDMYASRQSLLIEQNEKLLTENANLTARHQDYDEYLQQIIKDKVSLEMELKELLNKSNKTHSHFYNSIDVSCTEEQMLSALDSLNADSRFSTDHQILDEDAFDRQLKDDNGRLTDISLYDEIRLSFSMNNNRKRESAKETVGTQTENAVSVCEAQTDLGDCLNVDSCIECAKLKDRVARLQNDNNNLCNSVRDVKIELEEYERNFEILQTILSDEKKCNAAVIDKMRDLELSIGVLENRCLLQENELKKYVGVIFNEYEQASENVNPVTSDGKNKNNLDLSKATYEHFKSKQNDISEDKTFVNTYTQTCGCHNRIKDPDNLSDDSDVWIDCKNCCSESAKLQQNVARLKVDEEHCYRNIRSAKMEIDALKKLKESQISKERQSKNLLNTTNDRTKIDALEKQCLGLKRELKKYAGIKCVKCEQASMAVQADLPCVKCERRDRKTTRRSVWNCLWGAVTSLFQVLAVLCFACAAFVLYSMLSQRWACGGRSTPWRWWDLADLFDMLFRIEYVVDMPM